MKSEPGNSRPVIHLACSRGGHLDLLLRHRQAFAGFRTVWVTQRSARADRLRRDGADVHVLGEYHRSLLRGAPLVALWRSLGLVLRHRPRLVVTSGSGVVVPFCVLARLAGARVIFVETAARVRGASSSGRVLSRIAQQVIVQWKEMSAIYPGAKVACTSVVEDLASGSPPEGSGTFVAVGTHSQPFDRLLRMVDEAAAAGMLPTPVTAQVGPSSLRMDHAERKDFVTAEEMEAWIAGARYVVSHAGTGTIATALRAGRRPLVLARLERHGEHFDDHQQQIVDKLADLDLIVPIGGRITPDDLARADRPLEVPAELEQLPLLADCLAEQLRRSLG